MTVCPEGGGGGGLGSNNGSGQRAEPGSAAAACAATADSDASASKRPSGRLTARQAKGFSPRQDVPTTHVLAQLQSARPIPAGTSAAEACSSVTGCECRMRPPARFAYKAKRLGMTLRMSKVNTFWWPPPIQ